MCVIPTHCPMWPYMESAFRDCFQTNRQFKQRESLTSVIVYFKAELTSWETIPYHNRRRDMWQTFKWFISIETPDPVNKPRIKILLKCIYNQWIQLCCFKIWSLRKKRLRFSRVSLYRRNIESFIPFSLYPPSLSPFLSFKIHSINTNILKICRSNRIFIA